jgi:hypothetical protein
MGFGRQGLSEMNLPNYHLMNWDEERVLFSKVLENMLGCICTNKGLKIDSLGTN